MHLNASTFPDTLNLDLSGNNFRDLSALAAWKNKFRRLEHLVLSDNPLMENTSPADLRSELLRWYPQLRQLNGEVIRSEEELANAGKTLSRFFI